MEAVVIRLGRIGKVEAIYWLFQQATLDGAQIYIDAKLPF